MHFDSIFDSQIGPKSTPGGLLGRLGAIWGRRVATLDRVDAVLDCLGALSAPSSGFLEAPEPTGVR